MSELIDLVSNYGFAILLTACVISCLTGLLGLVFGIVMWRKCIALFELLLQQNDEHGKELKEEDEKHDAQVAQLQEKVFLHQEQATIQQSATIRQLLDSFSIAASGKPLD